MKRNGYALQLALFLTMVLAAFGCTKGMTVGGTDGNPAAVETAGVPPLPHHGPPAAGHGEAAADHGAPTSTASAHATPTEPGTASSHEAVPKQTPAKPPATTTGQSSAAGTVH